MRSHLSLIAALTGACLSAGCVIEPLPPPPVYRGGYAIAPEEIYVPSVIIVEHGVVHDRAFYVAHPEIYRRDRMRYPQRFVVVPPPRAPYHPPRPDYHRPDNHRPDNYRPDNHRPDNHRPDNHRPDSNHRPDNYRPDNHRPDFKPGNPQPGNPRPDAHHQDDRKKKKRTPDLPDGSGPR